MLLRGARQVGKSTLVRLFAAEQGLKLHEINLERHVELDKIFKTFNLDLILDALEGILKQSMKGPEPSLLFLDEIQATPHAIAALRYFFEDRPGLAVIAAGSLLEFVLADHAFSMPVGRIEYLHIEPMDFEEFLQASDDEWLLDKLRLFSWSLPWPETLHQSLMQRYRDFLLVGGMPEAVASWNADRQSDDYMRVQERIAATYQDDFAKYSSKARLPTLHAVYQQLPRFIGRKLKLSDINPDQRAYATREAIDLLSMARVIRLAQHSDGVGLPLSSQVDSKIAKPYWLDVGLLNRISGLPARASTLETQGAYEGTLAEQFVAQHLPALAGSILHHQLFYWLREGRQGNAELDFLQQIRGRIVPIEVKAGGSGSLKSLHYFCGLRHLSLGIQISAKLPKFESVTSRVAIKKEAEEVSYALLQLPFYLIGQLPRLIENSD